MFTSPAWTEPILWAGVGSRQAPFRMLQWARKIGHELAERNYLLSSGAADGMDRAFEEGVLTVDPCLTQIHLPWEGYNGHGSIHHTVSAEALRIGAQFHPAWSRLRLSVQLLHGRNSHIMLGRDCQTPVRFVVCWTLGGQVAGGTGQALRIAQHFQIPIYNLEQVAQSRVDYPIPF